MAQTAVTFNDVFEEEEKYAAAGPPAPSGALSNDVFEENDVEEVVAPTVHRIRANSTIMQLKKILGR